MSPKIKDLPPVVDSSRSSVRLPVATWRALKALTDYANRERPTGSKVTRDEMLLVFLRRGGVE